MLWGKSSFTHNPFEAVKKRTDLNALQKMKLAIQMNQSDEQQVELTRQAVPILKNPHVLARMIESNRRILCPYWQELIQEGIQDGSVQTEYPKEMAELLVLLDLWMIPSLFPADAKEQSRKYRFISEMLKKIGLELYDEEIEEMISKLPYYDQES